MFSNHHRVMNRKILIFVFVLFYKHQIVTPNTEDTATDCHEEEFGKIVHASVLFRHGDRNPYAPYPFDPFKNFQWAEGLGHLTNAGKKRLYELGKWFRRRYEHLLGLRYSYTESRMDSSDYDRSLMSAACFLAGFYPPTEVEMWNNENLNWHPIPIHSVPLPQDNMIAMFKMCDAYNYDLFGANTAPRYREMFKKHKNFFGYVGASTGIIFDENFIVFGLLKLMEVYDSLNVQNQNNFSLPAWSKPVFPEPMSSLAVRIFDIGTYTEKMKRLKAGPFLHSVTTDMYKKAYEQYEQTLHFYSGHDSTIATLMITLGIYNSILPPYGSSLIIELREKDSEYIVTILYKNSTETPPLLLEIPECKHICTLENFLDITKLFIPEDWDKECQVQPVIPQMPITHDWSNTSTDTWIFTTGQTAILGGVIAFLLYSMLYLSIQRSLTHLNTILATNQTNDIKQTP